MDLLVSTTVRQEGGERDVGGDKLSKNVPPLLLSDTLTIECL